jgi:hypothetical protein
VVAEFAIGLPQHFPWNAKRQRRALKLETRLAAQRAETFGMRKVLAARILRIANGNRMIAFEAHLRPANDAHIGPEGDARICGGRVVEILERIDRLIGFGIDREEIRLVIKGDAEGSLLQRGIGNHRMIDNVERAGEGTRRKKKASPQKAAQQPAEAHRKT